MIKPLKAPFPAFGGKSRAAEMTWARLSTPESPAKNFIEPFCYSAAMLLGRPDYDPATHVETINDLNAFVANFWRAVKCDPEQVARHADNPVNETDLHSRHRWLIESEESFAAMAAVKNDPEYYHAKIAGWWCWGLCCWIGAGWCTEYSEKRPSSGFDGNGKGILRGKRPDICGEWSNGKGVNAGPHGRPQLADAYARGRGVNANDSITAVEARHQWLLNWIISLSDRFRPVRVLCGHWLRCCNSPSVTTRLGITAVFLDPPYCYDIARMLKWYEYLCGRGEPPIELVENSNRAAGLYVNDKDQDIDKLVAEVAHWCMRWGDNSKMRIAVCGLAGEYPMLDELGWECVAWKSRGGYGNRRKGNNNNERERIWFNESCIRPESFGII